jgi:hypothetical protein
VASMARSMAAAVYGCCGLWLLRSMAAAVYGCCGLWLLMTLPILCYWPLAFRLLHMADRACQQNVANCP